MAETVTIELFDDPAAFLAVAAGVLAAEPVTGTVVATFTRDLAARVAAGERLPVGGPLWWAVARDLGGAVVGVAMRTAPFAPHPLFVLPMPDEAARELARVLVGRGERVDAANGALPASRVLLDEVATAQGGSVVVHVRLRLFEAGELCVPPAPPGRPRLADDRDVDLLAGWLRAFEREADEQAGRLPDDRSGDEVTREEVAGRIAAGRCWLWEDAQERPVALAGIAGPEHGVGRIGPVYTAPASRGRGYAGRLVATVARRMLAQGVRVCLFTDQANPVSNRLYERIGFRPVVDMAELRLVADR